LSVGQGCELTRSLCGQHDSVLLTLDLGLDIVDGVGRLHLEGDSLTRKGFDEDLHLDEGLYKHVRSPAASK
jgi:hypothetical protein